jgi:epsin
MLRQFHFIDQNGKDQGINVRNRAKELAELLSDVDRIRTERKKARANRNKFGGVEGGGGLGSGFSGSGGFSGGGSRYGGFGSESADFGGYSGGVYGDGGGFSGGGGSTSGFADSQTRRDRFDEYDEYDEGEVPATPRRKEPASSSTSQVKREVKKEEPAKPTAPVADLLAWDDEPAPAPASSAAGKQPVGSMSNDFGGDDDDFDDFQSAAPAAAPASAASAFARAPAAAPFITAPASTSTIGASTQFAAPQPQSAVQNNNFNDLIATVSPPPAANSMASPPASTPAAAMSQQYRPAGYQASGPNYFTSVNVQNQAQSAGSTPALMSSSIGGKKPGSAAPKASGGDAFASLLSGAPKKTGTPTQRVTMADMAKQKTSAGLWGAPASSSSTSAAQTPASGSKPGGALGDLLG